MLALVRTGKWEQIINDTDTPPAEHIYASILYHFAKGMAYAHTGKSKAAASALQQLHARMYEPVMLKWNIPFNTPVNCAAIAGDILEGTIHMEKKRYSKAVAALERAVRQEDSLIYAEPKDWLLPARQYLGACLLKAGKAIKAEAVYREDLVWNPGNGWSLLGLSQSLAAQGKNEQAAIAEKACNSAFASAERIPPASVY